MNIRGDDDWYELYNLREDPGETRDLIGSGRRSSRNSKP